MDPKSRKMVSGSWTFPLVPDIMELERFLIVGKRKIVKVKKNQFPMSLNIPTGLLAFSRFFSPESQISFYPYVPNVSIGPLMVWAEDSIQRMKRMAVSAQMWPPILQRLQQIGSMTSRY